MQPNQCTCHTSVISAPSAVYLSNSSHQCSLSSLPVTQKTSVLPIISVSVTQPSYSSAPFTHPPITVYPSHSDPSAVYPPHSQPSAVYPSHSRPSAVYLSYRCYQQHTCLTTSISSLPVIQPPSAMYLSHSCYRNCPSVTRARNVQNILD